MSDKLDRVLEVLDVGLQDSWEGGFTTDHAPTRCARCQLDEPAADGDLCPRCRAFLLGDTEADPTRIPNTHPSTARRARPFFAPAAVQAAADFERSWAEALDVVSSTADDIERLRASAEHPPARRGLASVIVSIDTDALRRGLDALASAGWSSAEFADRIGDALRAVARDAIRIVPARQGRTRRSTPRQ